MMKKLITLMLVVAMLLPGIALAAYSEDFQPGTHINVGSVTRLTGNFFTELWGNNTADMDVRELLHGLSTVTWDDEHQYAINPNVVRQLKCEGDAETHEGPKTYTFLLYNNMRFSDGELMSAQDYVFSILLQASPVLAEMGVDSSAYNWIEGYEDYHSGKTKEFSGIRYLRHNTFEITIKEECLPYFYEMVYLKINPYPMHVIAPNCNVADAGEGAYIRGNFTKEVLEKTILDPETGYLSHPSAVAGAYALTSYDAESGTAEFKANRYFPGHYDGTKPVIDTITFKHVTYDEALEQLKSGELDILNKATDGAFIDQAKGAGVQYDSYDRNGYGFLAFACEETEPVTGSDAVRRAIAMCVDYDAFLEDFLKGYGKRVYGHYGNATWVAQDFMDEMTEICTVYNFDTAAAEELLEADGWVKAVDGIRYKTMEDGSTQALKIRYGQTADNRAAIWMTENLVPVLESIGFQVEVTEIPFDQVLANYYRQGDERLYNMTFMASNFNYVYDLLYNFSDAQEHQGVHNTSGIVDEELLHYATKMHNTYPGNLYDFKLLWQKMMKRYSQVLPTLPLYSSEYYDFYANDLVGYDIAGHTSWAQAILYTKVK